MISRRKFISGALAGGVAASMPLAACAEVVTDDIETCWLTITNSRVKPAFHGYRIGFLTDIHCGLFLSDQLLENSINIINQSKVDVLLLGGDYISIPDSYPAKLYSSGRNPAFKGKYSSDLVVKIFNRLGNALLKANVSDGIYAVLGNHDHWNNSKLCMQTLEGYNVNFLVNKAAKISRASTSISIFGCDDYWTGVPTLNADFARSDEYRVFVSHNPDYVAECLTRYGNCFDLSLSGHTHGGQVRLPAIGPIAGYNVRHTQFGMGSVKIGDSIAYTSKGVGVVDLPYRINCKPEATIVELRQA